MGATTLLLLLSTQLQVDWAPKGGTAELGVVSGALLSAGSVTLSEALDMQHPMDRAGFSFGLRLAWLPAPALALESEAAHVAFDGGAGVDPGLYTLRGHLLLQLPGQLTPFVLGGGGVVGRRAAGEMGHQERWAAHWGLGAKLYLSPEIQVRVDGRHVISFAEGAQAHHLELTCGLAFTLGG